MAICKTDGSIESIRGRFGGVYFKKDASGQHIQAMPRHVYNTFGGTMPPILHHSATSRWVNIFAFTKASRAFFYLAAAGAISGFGEIAEFWLWPTKSGMRKRLAAYHWWMHYNTIRYAKGLPPYTIPPKSLKDYPSFVITGKEWGQNTLNMYKSDIKHAGYPFYRMQVNPWWWQEWFLFREGDTNYISNNLGHEPGQDYWTKPDGEETGIYSPSRPELGIATVDF